MKKLYLEPKFDILDLQSEDFLALSPEISDDDNDIPDTPEDFTGGTSGDIPSEKPPSIFG